MATTRRPFKLSIPSLVFSIAYGLVVLPFTVQFFTEIANPSTTATFFNLIPLEQLHTFALPVFLFILELITVQLAMSFWRSNGSDRVLIIGLFLAAQTLPMVSTYYDVRARDFEDIKRVTAERGSYEAKKKEIDEKYASESVAWASVQSALEQERDSLKTSIERTEAEIASLQNQTGWLTFAKLNNVLAPQLQRQQETLAQSIRKIQEHSTRAAVRISYPDEPEGSADPILARAPTKIDFIVVDFGTSRSLFAAFISLLFPITILALGYVLSGTGDNSEHELRSFDISIASELAVAEKLPKQYHINCAKTLGPVIVGMLASFKAYKDHAISLTRYHLETERDMSLVEASSQLIREIERSALDGQAKTELAAVAASSP